MKIDTYTHPDHKHKFIITEEALHHDKGVRWIMQQLDEKGNILPRDAVLNKEEYDKMVTELGKQGWKVLLEG